MSYDVDIGDHSFNYTYNVSKLFYDHIPETHGQPGGVYALHGLTGKQAAKVIGSFFNNVCETKNTLWKSDVVGEPDFCARYDAPNGWGSTIGGLLFMAIIFVACIENPRKIVRVS